MYNLWCLVVYGYIPKWEILEKANIHDNEGFIIGTVIILQCKKSGRIKHKVYKNITYF